MNMNKLSRNMKAVYDILVHLVINGWMSGSYTGAVLTECSHSVKGAGRAD